MPATVTAGADRRLALASPILLLAVAAVFFGTRIWHGIWFLPFVDEAEHLLGGMLLDRGAILYRSFIDAHGPVTFMLTQAYGAVFGWSNPNGARSISAALALCACGCIAGSPVLPGRIAKLWAAALFCGLLASVWLLQALYMVNYHAIAGFFIAIALAVFIVPVWHRTPTSSPRAFVAGACCLLVIATAYAFGPAMVLLGASAVWAAWLGQARHSIVWLAAGAAAAFLAVFGWILLFGDIVGYVTYHFIDNQFYYARYVPLSLRQFSTALLPSAQPAALVHSLALVACLAAALICLALDRWRAAGSIKAGGLAKVGGSAEMRGLAKMADAPKMAGPILLGFAALLALCARGGWMFQDGSFLVASLAMLALELPLLLTRVPRPHAIPRPVWICAGSIVAGLCIATAEITMRHALDSPWMLTRQQIVAEPRFNLGISQAPLYARIRALTDPDDRILVLPYAPDIFLASGRLPMDKYSLYLPWDADYARAPWFGRDRDLCADMVKTPPKLIFFNNWIVWGRYAMADYAPCFTAILARDYTRQIDFPDLYLRRETPGARHTDTAGTGSGFADEHQRRVAVLR